ncbi:MAG: ATP-binding protein [Burkholderiales bacterium]
MSSIRHRLLALLLGVIAAMSAVHAFVTWRIARDEAREQSDLQLRQAAVLVLRGRFAPTERPAGPAARYDPRSELLVRVEDDTSRWASHPEAVLPAAPADGFATVRTTAGPLRVYSLRVGTRTVRVGQYEWVRDANARRAALRNLAPMAVVVPALMLLAWAVVVRSLRPLDALAGRLRERAPDDAGPIGEAGLPRELAPVARALDGLLARVEEMVAMQRAFVADAAHELRTPVTALALQLDLVRRTPPGPEREQRLQRLEDGVSRASRMVSQLLALARSDGAGPAADAGPVDLAAVCREAATATLGLADAAGSTIEAELPESPGSALVAGDAQQLDSMARNLIENAVRHAPGCTVRVALAARGDDVLLEVVDDGPGIPAVQRVQALERFSRLAGAPAGGSGLGLAIVRSVVQRHGGEVALLDGDGRPPRPGLRVRVRLPASMRAAAAPRTPPR